jgi:SAM-dependent methyltransferase
MPLERTVRHLTCLYDTDADPWGHLTRAYEREKYARTLDAMGARQFRQGLEVGCGIGALTDLLAPRCDRLTSIECVSAALARARMRMAGAPHVILIEGAAPDDLPPIAPDLIVLSEVLYFMTPGEIDRLAAWIGTNARPDVLIIVVSWEGDTGEALSGRASVERFFSTLLRHGAHRRAGHDGYRIDTFQASSQRLKHTGSVMCIPGAAAGSQDHHLAPAPQPAHRHVRRPTSHTPRLSPAATAEPGRTPASDHGVLPDGAKRAEEGHVGLIEY